MIDLAIYHAVLLTLMLLESLALLVEARVAPRLVRCGYRAIRQRPGATPTGSGNVGTVQATYGVRDGLSLHVCLTSVSQLASRAETVAGYVVASLGWN